MPQNIKLRVSVNAGAPQEGQADGVTIDYDDALVFSINDVAGVDSALFRIYEFPDGFAEPSGWSTNSEDGAYYYLSKNGAPPPTVAAPPSPLWGDVLCDVKVNQGKRQGVNVSDLYDNSLGLTLPSPNGIPDFPYREDKQFNTQRSWVSKLKNLARTVSAGVSGALPSIATDRVYGNATGGSSPPVSTPIQDITATQGTATAKIAPYPTMADLRAVTPVSGRTAETQGHTTAGDGGGGRWIGMTGAAATWTHDGGITLVPSSGTGSDGSSAWVRQFSGPIDVRWYGAAVGASAATNGTAIRAAIAALTSGGGILSVPPGTYAYDYFGTIPQQVTVQGAGGGVTSSTNKTTVFVKSVSATNGVIINGTSAGIKGCIIKGQAGDTSTRGGIWVQSGAQTVIEDVLVVSFPGVGVRHGNENADTAGNLNSWRVKNLNVSECGTGWLLDDKPGNPSDANAGVANGVFVRQCTGNGIELKNAWFNNFSGVLTEGNTGIGLLFGDGASWNTFFEGDAEGNGTNIEYSGTTRENKIEWGQLREPENIPANAVAGTVITVSVRGRQFLQCNNSAATIIAAFDQSSWGQRLTLRLDGLTTLRSSSTLRTLDGFDLTGNSNMVVELINNVGVWRVMSQSQVTERVYKPVMTPRLASYFKGDDADATIVAGSPDVFSSIPDRGPLFSIGSSSSFTATSTARPEVTTRYGRDCPLFTTEPMRLTSGLNVEFYRALHDPDSSCLLSAHFRTPASLTGAQTVCATTYYSNVGIGFGITILSGTLYVYVANASGGSTPLGMHSSGGALSTATDYSVVVWKRRDLVTWYLNGTLIGSSTTLTAPTRTNNTYTMVIGNRGGGGGEVLGAEVYEVAMHVGDGIALWDVDQMRNYLTGKWA